MLLCMALLTRRVQILIDEERYTLLEREAERTGKPVAELIREAVDAHYGPDRAEQEAAYATVLAAGPMPVEDWPAMKDELLDTFYDAP